MDSRGRDVRLRAALGLIAATCLLFITGGPVSLAENDDSIRFPFLQNRPAYRLAPYQEPRRVPRVRTETTAQNPSSVEPTAFVAVFGDNLADLLAQGLSDNLADLPTVAVQRRTRANSGLVRTDFHDWPKAIQEAKTPETKIDVAVFMVGSNDRQSIREGDTVHEPLSPRWREIYTQRIDAVIQAFAQSKTPLVWVGAPPMRLERLSTDLIAFNDLYRERVQRANGIFVDIWPGFVDEENRYTQNGPDLSGQPARLRTGDGVHFTRAGARKAAHFGEAEIRRLLGGVAPAPAIAQPGPLPDLSDETLDPAARAAAADRLIDAAMPALPQPPGLGGLAPRPVAGPVHTLTRVELSENGALLSSAPKLSGEAAYIAERALIQGVAPAPRTGRIDDFRWPKP